MGKLKTSYWPADGSLEVRDTTVGSILREAAQQFGGTEALVEGKPGLPAARRRWTFEDLLTEAEQVAGALLERFDPGERVAVWAPNIPEWVLLELGAGLAGMVLVTVNPAYKPKELEYVLRQSGASGIFLVPEFRGNPMAASVEEVRPGLDALREVVPFPEWDAFLATCPASLQLPTVRPGDPAQIQYTSGTTGFPKGALLHHRGLTNNARIFTTLAGAQAGDVYVSPFPMFHTGGCVLGTLGSLQAGMRHVPVLAFDPTLMLELMEAERATIALGVPTVLIALLECPDLATRDLSSLRVVGSGGAPVPAQLVRSIEETLHVSFSIVYGTTECSPVVSQIRLDDAFEDKTGTLGQPVPQTEVKITDPATGDVVPLRDHRRALRPRLLRDDRIFPDGRTDRHGHRPRGLVPHEGPGLHGRSGLPANRRPPQRHDHPGRGKHLPPGDRGPALRPSQRGRGGGRRRAQLPVGGGSGRLHPGGPRPTGHRRRALRLLSGAPGFVQGAPPLGVR